MTPLGQSRAMRLRQEEIFAGNLCISTRYAANSPYGLQKLTLRIWRSLSQMSSVWREAAVPGRAQVLQELDEKPTYR